MTQVLTVKNKLTLVALFVAVAALLVMVFGLYGNMTAQAQAEEETNPKRTMSVSGQAKVTASPDFATINLGVITEDKDAMAAQKENAASMDKVIASVKASGVKAEDMKTVNYSIQPKYDYNDRTGENRIIGYMVSNSVNVTVRDLTKTGSIIDAAAQSGVNTTSNIKFGLSNYEEFYNEALGKAVLAAKKKADTIAGALGVKLIAPISVNEGGGYSPLSNYAVYDMKAASNVQTPIQAGSLEITANVSIVYEY
ncbi:MAG: SIMPL domain-containing protein [Clostridiaceae bacterium]|jgi:uncharacterized protein YggE|nr:SIMPL domain-containing protein [Clostridiaceae bacterium]